ncbi:MAG TPA: response regulator transcription factor [Blastocatellia bacterium]|jgi:two-component system, OmpR family, alkaline phosphatase synthesis response regulator PhoP
MSKRILLIEDEADLVLTLTDFLTNEGYLVLSATDGDAGLAYALQESFDLLILDVMLPRKNGFDVLRDLRQKDVQTPAIMLTARGQVLDRVLGLKLGADDYVTKPFDSIELAARIEAILRRIPAAKSARPDRYSFGDVRVDFQRAEITRDGQAIELSPREYYLLWHFIEHRERILSRDDLLDAVWGYDAMPVTRTVDVHVGQLRQKLERNPRQPEYFITIHGIGYKFVG